MWKDVVERCWERLGPNKYLIKEMNCAVAQVAKSFPETCIFEEGFLAELLLAKVTRRHHILQNDQYCSYLCEAASHAEKRQESLERLNCQRALRARFVTTFSIEKGDGNEC